MPEKRDKIILELKAHAHTDYEVNLNITHAFCKVKRKRAHVQRVKRIVIWGKSSGTIARVGDK